MREVDFGRRLSELRTKKGVSARNMSRALGQNLGYINHIENSQTMPSLPMFFSICEYLDTTPNEFLGEEKQTEESGVSAEMINDLEALTPEQLECISYLIKELKQKS